MQLSDETERYMELVVAFIAIAARRTDVQLRGSAEPGSLVYAVRLQPQPTSAGVDMLLWPGGARLTSWSADRRSDSAGMERELHVAFREGFRWECLQFPDAQSLALALFQRMQHELHGDASR